ncbi:7734_t:CDS:1 [Racocetra fulgida]|uniref:7734_t:CDS:1 n=1 Tax=Racocetra fulgida TaxID=60492 RepID=A0A9N8ZV78_9GLOM|nr:7734_t:CDS:1 [Racocetra fulgida]
MTDSLKNRRNILHYFEERDDSTFKYKLCLDDKPFILKSKEKLRNAKTHFFKRHSEIWNTIKQQPEERILNIRKFKRVQKKAITKNINQKWRAQNFSKIGTNDRGIAETTSNISIDSTNEFVSNQETIGIEILSNESEISNNVSGLIESDQETSTETLCNENDDNIEVHECDQEIQNNREAIVIEALSNQNKISNNKQAIIDNIKEIEATEDVYITNDQIIIKGKCKISFK